MSDGNTSSYGRLRDRLDEIVAQVSSKDVPLEKSLDLYEEALRLGGMAAEMIDKTDFTEAELGAVAADETDDDAVVAEDEAEKGTVADDDEAETDDVVPAG